MPQPNVPRVFEGVSLSQNLPMAESSLSEVYSPGVDGERRDFAYQAPCLPRPFIPPGVTIQAACLPRPSMLTPAEEVPPGVPIRTACLPRPPMPTPMASPYVHSYTHFNFMPPPSLQRGNIVLTLPPMPHGAMASRFSTWPYGSCFRSPLPPGMPPPLPPPLPTAPPQRFPMPSGPPLTVPTLGSCEETVNFDMTRKLSLPDKQKLIIFVGKILPSLDDDIVTSILKLCGSIRSWTRAEDPSTGSHKGFGFCEYESPEGLLRALRLLNRLKLQGQELVLKVDKNTLDYVENYVDKKIESLKPRVNIEAEGVPGLEPAHVVKQSLDVPREVPVEERLGWVFDEENEIDKEVCENLVNLLEERNRMEILDLPLGMTNDIDVDTIQASPTEEDRQRVQLIEWRKYEYDLEKCKLKGQGLHGGLRVSESFYLEYEKLWEERERAKEIQQKIERERDEAKRKMRQRLIKEQEESRTGLKRMRSDERHKRRVAENQKDDNDRILEQQNLIFTEASSFRSMDSSHRSKGEDAFVQMKFLDLSTRAKVAFCFKSSSKPKQSDQTYRSTAGCNALWEEDENTGDGYSQAKQVVSAFDYTPAFSGDDCWGQTKATDKGHKQQTQAVITPSYRNPTFTWERESTPEEQLLISEKDVANKPVNICSEKKPIILESCKPMNAKELIDKIPRTKDEVFAFCMNWETFDKHCLHERIRPWVSKKISEFLGEEEATLVDFIVTSARKHMTPAHLLDLLENIFVEEAELFVVKLWRTVIYEIRKVEFGLI